jgi:hypothetical protein
VTTTAAQMRMALLFLCSGLPARPFKIFCRHDNGTLIGEDFIKEISALQNKTES